MGHPCQTTKVQVIPARDACQGPPQVAAPCAQIHQPLPKGPHRLPGRRQQARRLGIVIEAPLELVEAVAQGADQEFPALVVLQQVILQVGVAGYHPHVPQDLEEHARRAPRAPRPP